MPLKGGDHLIVEVTGTTIAMVDVTSSSTDIVVDSVTLDRVPVPRNLTSVALLEPDALREQRNSSRNNVNGLYRIDNTQDEVDEWDVNV